MSATPVEKFGKDHWSMVDDGIGQVDKRRVRSNPERHPLQPSGPQQENGND